jgi:hypothetical protein
MSTSIVTYFKELTDQYTSYEAVKNFLTSDEGGRFRVVESGEYEGRYAIFRYVKDDTDMSLPHARFLRSVIWDRSTNKPVCIAPFKSNDGLPPTDETMVVEDYIDGVMVNLFVNDNGQTVIATRTSIGAKGSFYTNTSFSDMFAAAAHACGYNTVDDLGAALVQQGYSFASFVLQHPEHRIVARIRSPRIYLITVGTVDGAYIHVHNYNPDVFKNLQVNRYAPQKFDEASAFQLVQQLAELRGWTWQGLVFKGGDSTRWRIRSQTYSNLKNLRGVESKAEERFLRLRKWGLVKNYLQHYSEDRDVFWQLEQNMRTKTVAIFDAYRCVHKQHLLIFSELQKEYQTPVFRLHAKYLAAKKAGTSYKIEMKDVIQFVNEMLPYEQLRILNAPPFLAPTVNA